MIKNGFLFLLLTSSLLISPTARTADQQAGFVLFPSFFWQTSSGRLSGDETQFGLDFRAGYRIPSGFYFGLIYMNNSIGGTNTTVQSGLGNTVGYTFDVFTAAISFFLVATSNETTLTNSTQRSEGTGIQIDLAATLPVSSSLSIGPVLAYKNLTFQKRQDNGGNLTTAIQTQISITPQLGIMFTF